LGTAVLIGVSLGIRDRTRAPKIVLLIFVSGKIVLTGAKFRCADLTESAEILCAPLLYSLSTALLLSTVFPLSTAVLPTFFRHQIYTAFNTIYPVLEQFKKQDMPG